MRGGWRIIVVVVLVVGGGASEARAICRVVGQPNSPPPAVEPNQPVLIIKRRQVIGEQCQPPVEPDGGASGDAGAGDAGAGDAGAGDAGASADAGDPVDAGASADAGDAVDAGAAPDAGPAGDAGPSADAMWPCDPIEGDAVTMVVQPRFRIGEDGSTFALLMVTPSPPAVSIAADTLFRSLALATAPEAVVVPRYVEDVSLGYQCKDPKWNSSSAGGCGTGGGYWDNGDDYDLPDPTPVDLPEPDDAALVDTIGAYQVARLQLASTDELAAWLDDNGYLYGPSDIDALRPYVEAGWTTVAVRVTATEALDGGLEPLSLTWAGTEIRLPLGVSRQPPPAEAWLTVYIAAEGRYELPGADVRYAQRTAMGGAQFLTRNDVWVDLSLGADSDPIATRVSGDPTHRDTVEVDQEIRIPSSECPYSPADEPACDCRTTGASGFSGLVSFALIAACGWFAARRRRRRRR